MKKSKRRKASTALARRTPAAVARRELVSTAGFMRVVTPGSSMALERLGDPMMTASFIGTLVLKQKAIDALRRPVLETEIEWKPATKDGPAIIPYLSHNGYRDRLDAAFGLGGWGMVPVGMPKSMPGQGGDEFIYVPYALCVGGVPRVYAWGEQQIHKMTYGDALEGCKSNAIVRCGKELGIARELWDRKTIDGLKRRKGMVVADGATRSSTPATRSSYHAHEDEPVTKPQRQRLYAIAGKSGRPEHEWKMWIKITYGVNSTKDIKRRDYNAICEAIERPGPLPIAQAPREPGMEG